MKQFTTREINLPIHPEAFTKVNNEEYNRQEIARKMANYISNTFTLRKYDSPDGNEITELELFTIEREEIEFIISMFIKTKPMLSEEEIKKIKQIFYTQI